MISVIIYELGAIELQRTQVKLGTYACSNSFVFDGTTFAIGCMHVKSRVLDKLDLLSLRLLTFTSLLSASSFEVHCL